VADAKCLPRTNKGVSCSLILRGELLFGKTTARDRAVEYVESGLCAPDICSGKLFQVM
jgi:hypothetical protein